MIMNVYGGKRTAKRTTSVQVGVEVGAKAGAKVAAATEGDNGCEDLVTGSWVAGSRALVWKSQGGGG